MKIDIEFYFLNDFPWISNRRPNEDSIFKRCILLFIFSENITVYQMIFYSFFFNLQAPH